MSTTRVMNTTVTFVLILFSFKIYSQGKITLSHIFSPEVLIVCAAILTWFLAVSRIRLSYGISECIQLAKQGVNSNSPLQENVDRIIMHLYRN